MPQTIKLKRSAIDGNVPTVTQLSLGEFAINTTDGKIFLKKKDALNVEFIIEVQANAVGSSTSFNTLATTPTSAVEGDFWYNTSDNTLYIYNGSDWAAIGGDNAQSTTRTSTSDPTTRTDGTTLQVGDTYWNTNDSDLYLYNGSDWITVAPKSAAPSVPHLGNNTTDPSARPSGSALSAGDMYWNTADSEMRVYTGISGNLWTEQQKIQASDAQSDDLFSASVSISGDGDTAIVGAITEDPSGINNAGSAYIFTRSGGVWTEQQKIKASDAQAYDEFGTSVSISGDGDTAIVGAYGEGTGGTRAGAAYVFV